MASEELRALIAKLHAEDAERGYRMIPSIQLPPEQLRAACEIMDQIAEPIPAGVASRTEVIGGVAGLWFEPENCDRERVIVYFHGGGFMFGTPLNTGHVTARLAAAAGIPAFSVAYRLSWQAPFPAPVEDAVAVFRALLALGYQSQHIAFAGDSAGGGLAVAAILALRDQGGLLPAACFATSPWTDLAHTGASIQENEASDVICTAAGLEIMAKAYVAGADARSPLASPLYGELAGLPPLLVQTGGNEQLRDDGIRLAERARTAGVDVTLEVIDGGVHIWQYVGPGLPETCQTETSAGRFLSKHLRKGA
jgi:epsilon-lactone hydrolase